MTTIRQEFTVHRLTEAGLTKAEQLAADFSALLDKIEQTVPQGPGNMREMAIVRTKLQESCFFAKRALALHPAVQQDIPRAT